MKDAPFRLGTRASAWLLILIFAGILASLLLLSWPSLRQFGIGFLVSSEWNPVTKEFGAWPSIVGTIVCSLIAIVLGTVISFGVAFFITEIAPRRIRGVVARLIELMAGIPSIIYGMWGLFVLVPFMATTVQPWLMKVFAPIPVLNQVFGGAPTGVGLFTAGVVLAIMVTPLVSSVMRDVLATVPASMKEAAYAVSATRWEVIRYVLLPKTKIGLIGAVILGFGRALGETMAVTFVIGNAHSLTESLFMPTTTIAASIANEFNEANGALYRSSLMEIGLILFVITFLILLASRLLISLTSRQSG